jgi:hypothetical protein
VQQEQDVSQRDMFHGLLRHHAFEARGVSKTAAVTFVQLEHDAVTALPVTYGHGVVAALGAGGF